MNKQSGFTLIELVMVIVILGVLAAVAMPKFVDLKGDAQASALQGVVGAMNSAMSINYAARSANSSKGAAVADCTDIATILQGGIPTGYTVASATVTAGSTASCTVTQTASSATATFTAFGI
jgi:prepilin-type N-terminal cleavage/methylation domain-containing protein